MPSAEHRRRRGRKASGPTEEPAAEPGALVVAAATSRGTAAVQMTGPAVGYAEASTGQARTRGNSGGNDTSSSASSSAPRRRRRRTRDRRRRARSEPRLAATPAIDDGTRNAGETGATADPTGDTAMIDTPFGPMKKWEAEVLMKATSRLGIKCHDERQATAPPKLQQVQVRHQVNISPTESAGELGTAVLSPEALYSRASSPRTPYPESSTAPRQAADGGGSTMAGAGGGGDDMVLPSGVGGAGSKAGGDDGGDEWEKNAFAPEAEEHQQPTEQWSGQGGAWRDWRWSQGGAWKDWGWSQSSSNFGPAPAAKCNFATEGRDEHGGTPVATRIREFFEREGSSVAELEVVACMVAASPGRVRAAANGVQDLKYIKGVGQLEIIMVVEPPPPTETSPNRKRARGSAEELAVLKRLHGKGPATSSGGGGKASGGSKGSGGKQWAKGRSASSGKPWMRGRGASGSKP